MKRFHNCNCKPPVTMPPRVLTFIHRRILLPLLATSALTTAYGNIEWKQKEMSIEVKAGQGSVDVSFPFVVTGSDSVTVLSTKTSGTCVVVTPIQGEIKPGTEGALNIRYTPPKDVAGTMVEKITVNTTDPKTPETELKLEVYIPLT